MLIHSIARCYLLSVVLPLTLAGSETPLATPLGDLPAAAIGAPFPVAPEDYEAFVDAPELWLPNIPLDDDVVTLHLFRQDPYSPDAQLVNVTAAGEQPLPRPPVAIFSGEIVDQPGTLAFLSVAPFGVQGFVQRNPITYIISSGRYGSGLQPLIFNLQALPPDALNWQPFQCGADDLPPVPGSGKNGGAGGGGTGPRDNPCRVARIAFETDNEFLATFSNSTTQASAYVATLVGAMSTIYKADINTRITASYLRLWTTPDPWTKTTTGDQLGEFQNYWNATPPAGVTFNSAHFLSTRGLGGGVAYLGALCVSGWNYAVSANLAGSFPYPLVDHSGANWDIMVTSHEEGHNFNAPHTHSTAPPIDNCGNGDCSQAWGGTIMSYCHTCSGGMTNIVLDLHPTIENNYILPFLGSENINCNLSDFPTIATQPQSQTVCAYHPVTFTMFPSTYNGTLTFQWYKDYVPVPNQPLNILTLPAPVAADAGSYIVVLTDDCGATASSAAHLTIANPVNCPVPGDVNGDRHVDLSDLAAIMAVYGLCSGSPGYVAAADVIKDGCINLSDIAVALSFYGT